jgi:hypothetical protein
MAVGVRHVWPRGALYPQKLAITSPTSGGCSVGIVRSRTQTMEFFFNISAFSYSIIAVHFCVYDKFLFNEAGKLLNCGVELKLLYPARYYRSFQTRAIQEHMKSAWECCDGTKDLQLNPKVLGSFIWGDGINCKETWEFKDCLTVVCPSFMFMIGFGLW